MIEGSSYQESTVDKTDTRKTANKKYIYIKKIKI